MLVSVIIPTYNCAKYIEGSFHSVINQTVNDWELQIIDACSIDNTTDIIQPILNHYSNIHYYRLPQNGGSSVAITVGIKRARGKYIDFLDSDELWNKDKLEKQISFM